MKIRKCRKDFIFKQRRKLPNSFIFLDGFCKELIGHVRKMYIVYEYFLYSECLQCELEGVVLGGETDLNTKFVLN